MCSAEIYFPYSVLKWLLGISAILLSISGTPKADLDCAEDVPSISSELQPCFGVFRFILSYNLFTLSLHKFKFPSSHAQTLFNSSAKRNNLGN